MTATSALPRAITWEGPERLAVRTQDAPPLRPGQVLLRVESVGVCGTDVAVWRGDGDRGVPGTVIGHEFGGTVVDRGDGVSGIDVGAHVAVDPNLTCGRCASCRSGARGTCPERRLMGIDVDGGLQEVLAVDAGQLIRVPGVVDPRALALVEPIAVGVHACARAGSGSAGRVGIIGGGAIGMAAALQARELGAECVVLEPDATRREAIAGYGVTPVTDRSWPRRSFDAVIDTVGSAGSVATAVDGAADGSTICVVGLAHGGSMPSSEPFVRRELRLAGSFCYTSADLERAARLVAQHGLDALPADIVTGFENAPRVFQSLARGRLGRGKTVIVPGRTEGSRH